ncbi:hypothetical protein [Caulobacter sp. RHG1]|uniref:hypothetical protein n=1 Tax=Caulobacter sp. (strain RHG1) TaxID=2545762 RepID=UPI0015542EFD|nr:hypothetical protein [Caulobacter sp. RHG1]NQE62142.1 hypothetical protein [Caulobacter sp. RHG1]
MSLDTLNLTLILSMAFGAIVVGFLIWDAQRAHEANIAFQTLKRREAMESSGGKPDEVNGQHDASAVAASNGSWSGKGRRPQRTFGPPAKTDHPNNVDKASYSLINLGKASVLTRAPPAEPRPPKKARGRRKK